MNTNEMFPSKYLKASDIPSPRVLTMTDVVFETLKGENGDEEKPVLYFKEVEKGMVLNRTNAMTITALYGDETDEWAGQRVTLQSMDVEAYGKTTAALRVGTKKPPIDKATLIQHYQTLWEKGKALKVEGIENYVVSPSMTEKEITDLGKELKVKVEAAEAFA